jgi:DNA invertase Pin-like site-specific DNA recombinase
MTPTLLDDELERHEGPEPRVVAEDVKHILEGATRRGEDDGSGDSVSLIAEKAKVSTRTVYRALNPQNETLSLDLADRLCLAADSHVAMCRLQWPNGSRTGYTARGPDTI